MDAVQLSGDDIPALVERMRRLQQRRMELRAERDRQRAVRPLTTDQLAELEADLLTCVAERREMCREQPAEARRLLDDVLVKRMLWVPRPDARGGCYEFTAECSLWRLVSGVLGHPKRKWPQGDTTEGGTSSHL